MRVQYRIQMLDTCMFNRPVLYFKILFSQKCAISCSCSCFVL